MRFTMVSMFRYSLPSDRTDKTSHSGSNSSGETEECFQDYSQKDEDVSVSPAESRGTACASSAVFTEPASAEGSSSPWSRHVRNLTEGLSEWIPSRSMLSRATYAMAVTVTAARMLDSMMPVVAGYPESDFSGDMAYGDFSGSAAHMMNTTAGWGQHELTTLEDMDAGYRTVDSFQTVLSWVFGFVQGMQAWISFKERQSGMERRDTISAIDHQMREWMQGDHSEDYSTRLEGKLASIAFSKMQQADGNSEGFVHDLIAHMIDKAESPDKPSDSDMQELAAMVLIGVPSIASQISKIVNYKKYGSVSAAKAEVGDDVEQQVTDSNAETIPMHDTMNPLPDNTVTLEMQRDLAKMLVDWLNRANGHDTMNTEEEIKSAMKEFKKLPHATISMSPTSMYNNKVGVRKNTVDIMVGFGKGSADVVGRKRSSLLDGDMRKHATAAVFDTADAACNFLPTIMLTLFPPSAGTYAPVVRLPLENMIWTMGIPTLMGTSIVSMNRQLEDKKSLRRELLGFANALRAQEEGIMDAREKGEDYFKGIMSNEQAVAHIYVALQAIRILVIELEGYLHNPLKDDLHRVDFKVRGPHYNSVEDRASDSSDGEVVVEIEKSTTRQEHKDILAQSSAMRKVEEYRTAKHTTEDRGDGISLVIRAKAMRDNAVLSAVGRTTESRSIRSSAVAAGSTLIGGSMSLVPTVDVMQALVNSKGFMGTTYDGQKVQWSVGSAQVFTGSYAPSVFYLGTGFMRIADYMSQVTNTPVSTRTFMLHMNDFTDSVCNSIQDRDRIAGITVDASSQSVRTLSDEPEDEQVHTEETSPFIPSPTSSNTTEQLTGKSKAIPMPDAADLTREHPLKSSDVIEAGEEMVKVMESSKEATFAVLSDTIIKLENACAESGRSFSDTKLLDVFANLAVDNLVRKAEPRGEWDRDVAVLQSRIAMSEMSVSDAVDAIRFISDLDVDTKRKTTIGSDLHTVTQSSSSIE